MSHDRLSIYIEKEKGILSWRDSLDKKCYTLRNNVPRDKVVRDTLRYHYLNHHGEDHKEPLTWRIDICHMIE